MVWLNPINYVLFDFVYLNDNFTFLTKLYFILFLCIFFFVFKEYFFCKFIITVELLLLLFFSVLGLFFFITANDFLVMYLALELYSLSIYGVISMFKNSILLIEAAIKYFIVSSLSTSFILFGVALLYFYTGIINFYDLELYILSYELLNFSTNKIYFYMSTLLINFGFLTKISAAPMHV